MTCFFGKDLVDSLEIKTELKNRKQKSCDDEDYRNDGSDEIKNDGRKNKAESEVEPAVERAGIFLKGFNIGSFASAVILENLCHVFAGFLFSLGAGCSLIDVFANIGDFVNHIFCPIKLLVYDFS